MKIKIDEHTMIEAEEGYTARDYQERIKESEMLSRPMNASKMKSRQQTIDDCKYNYNGVCHKARQYRDCDGICYRMKSYDKRNGGKK